MAMKFVSGRLETGRGRTKQAVVACAAFASLVVSSGCAPGDGPDARLFPQTSETVTSTPDFPKTPSRNARPIEFFPINRPPVDFREEPAATPAPSLKLKLKSISIDPSQRAVWSTVEVIHAGVTQEIRFAGELRGRASQAQGQQLVGAASAELKPVDPPSNSLQLAGRAFCEDFPKCDVMIVDFWYRDGMQLARQQFVTSPLNTPSPQSPETPASPLGDNPLEGDGQQGEYVGVIPDDDEVVEATPSQQRPEATPSQQGPEATPSQQRPEATPSQQRPEATPSQQRPEATPSSSAPPSGGRPINVPLPPTRPSPPSAAPVATPVPEPSQGGRPVNIPLPPTRPSPSNIPVPSPSPRPQTPSRETEPALERERRLAPLLDLRSGGEAQGTYSTIRSGERVISVGRLVRASEPPLRGPYHRFTYPERQRHFGAGLMVSFLERVGPEMRKLFPDFEMWVGDIALKQGGPIHGSNHNSHQNGLDIDIPFIGLPRAWDSALSSEGRLRREFDIARNWQFWRIAVGQRVRLVDQESGRVKETSAVQFIFVHSDIARGLCQWYQERRLDQGDEADLDFEVMRRIWPAPGHDKHFHLRFKCSPHYPLCRQQAETPRETGCGWKGVRPRSAR
jgi:murein endopeptidase